MNSQLTSHFDTLWPSEELISWRIPIRCRSGINGKVPWPKEAETGSSTDVVELIIQAMSSLESLCRVVVVVGKAGTGKTATLGWLLRSLEKDGVDVSSAAFHCSSRTKEELVEFFEQPPTFDVPQWFVIDSLDELTGEKPNSIHELLHPILPRLLDGTARVVLSVRSEDAPSILKSPEGEQLISREWESVWAGIEIATGLWVAVFHLEELRIRDMELYAAQRKLSKGFVSHLRSLYNLRELVCRFFLLVKLCELSEKLAPDEWKQIRARNLLYERLLTTWLTSEHTRNPSKLPLEAKDLLILLEQVAFQVVRWTRGGEEGLVTQLGGVLKAIGEFELRGADPHVVAAALVNANIICETGFAHKSMEEYLLALALSKSMRTGQSDQLDPTRVTDEVISFSR